MVKSNGTNRLLIDRYVWALAIGKNHAFKKALKQEITGMWKTLSPEDRVSFADRMREVADQVEENIKNFKKEHLRIINEKEFTKNWQDHLKFALSPPNQVIVKDEKGKTVLFLQIEDIVETEEEKETAKKEMERMIDELKSEQNDEFK